MSGSGSATRAPARRAPGAGQPVDLGACTRWPRRRRTLLRLAVQPHAPRRSATGGLMRLLEGAIAALKRQSRRSQGIRPRLMVVARGGVEPPTFRFSVGRSYQLSYLALQQRVQRPHTLSDPDRTRTGDLRRDRAAL